MNSSFLAGAASRPITPQLGPQPVYLAGFSSNRCATGVHDELMARALALAYGATTLVVVACDLIGLPYADVLQMRAELASAQSKIQNPKSKIELLVSCTHTHSGPDTLGLWGPDAATSGVDLEYLAFVRQQVVAAALEALATLRPAQMCQATARFPGWIKNLRDPAIVDDELAVLRFEDEQGKHIGCILNLACHPEVLDDDSHLVSADFAGASCRTFEAQEGGVALFVPGALGGMLSPATTTRTPEEAQAMGEALVAVALAALGTARACPVQQLVLHRTPLHLPLANPLFRAALTAGLLRKSAVVDLVVGTITSEMTYVDLGSAQMISLPGELLPRLGFELKAAMPGPCRLLLGLTDDELGYILPDDVFVPPEDYHNPGAQYEESMSLGLNTGSLMVAAALRLIREP